MTTQEQISDHIARQPEPKRNDMQALHRLILKISPEATLWFDDGKNEENRTVTNPTIGYGSYTIKYAGGKTREFFRVGLSANATGISIYIMGIADKAYLPQHYGKDIGKAKVTGYCIRFKKLEDIDISVLESAIRYGLQANSEI